jgi:ribonuclease-3
MERKKKTESGLCRAPAAIRPKLAPPDPVRALERRLGYRFRDRSLLDVALTHSSYRFETPGVAFDNQRMEFLGDAALALGSAAWLYRRCPDYQEGPLTEARSRCIRRSSLAAVARTLELGGELRMGRGERLSGGADRDSTLEDALEALLGAVFLDGGWRAVERVFDRVFKPLLEARADAGQTLNPKGELQEICQARWKKSPEYRPVSETGPAHQKQFEVEVILTEHVRARGAGASLQKAETEAARTALQEWRDRISRAEETDV